MIKKPLKVTFSIQPWIHEGGEAEAPKRIDFQTVIANDDGFDVAFDEFIACIKQSMKRHASAYK